MIEDAVSHLVGRTITAVEEVDNADADGWCEHESYILTLDDGRRVEFSGWGHDAWGCQVDFYGEPQPEPEPLPVDTTQVKPLGIRDAFGDGVCSQSVANGPEPDPED